MLRACPRIQIKTLREHWNVGDVTLDQEALAETIDEGRTMSVEQLVAYALEPPAGLA
jgi:hypothetical protein